MNSLNGLRVLIVENQPTEADELERAFVAVGTTVVVQTCAKALSSRPADVAAVVLDWLPATTERRDLVRSLREQKIPYVYYCEPPPTNAIESLGALFVLKPAPPDDVVAAVATTITEKAGR